MTIYLIAKLMDKARIIDLCSDQEGYIQFCCGFLGFIEMAIYVFLIVVLVGGGIQ